MECIVCGKESKNECCSGRCRARKSRRTRTDEAHAPERTLKQPPPLDIVYSLVGNDVKPANFGQPDCECQHCQTNRVNGNKHTINHGAWKSAQELDEGELNRVALPGDVDYTSSTKAIAAPCKP